MQLEATNRTPAVSISATGIEMKGECYPEDITAFANYTPSDTDSATNTPSALEATSTTSESNTLAKTVEQSIPTKVIRSVGERQIHFLSNVHRQSSINFKYGIREASPVRPTFLLD